MKIEEPYVHYLQQIDEDNHIATCARICYASEKFSGIDNNKRLINHLYNNNHRSMFRHCGVYYIIPRNTGFNVDAKYMSYMDITYSSDNIYIATNKQVEIEAMKAYESYKINVNDAFNNDIFIRNKILRITLVCNTQIAISRELNRKSPNNIAERSTRYVDYTKKIGIIFSKPHWYNSLSFYGRALSKLLMFGAQCAYRIAKSKYGLNLKHQDARYFLPVGIKTKVAYTYSVKDWEYIINCRLWDYTGPAHPDAKVVALQFYDIINRLGYKLVYYGK